MRGAWAVGLGCVLAVGLGMILATAEFDTPGSAPFTCRPAVEAAWGDGLTGPETVASAPLVPGRAPENPNRACVGGARVRLAASFVLIGGAVATLALGDRLRKRPVSV